MTPALTALAATLAALLLSMAVHAIFGRRRDPDAERKGSQFLMGVGDFLVHWLMETRPQAFVDYVRLAYSEKFGGQVRVSEEEAFSEVFKDDLEAAFEQWAKALPPHPPTQQ